MDQTDHRCVPQCGHPSSWLGEGVHLVTTSKREGCRGTLPCIDPCQEYFDRMPAATIMLRTRLFRVARSSMSHPKG